jgi:dTDP-4-dehydrorhamnose reductase
MTCSGSTTWCGFAQRIFDRGGRLLDGEPPAVRPISSKEYPTPAKRPRNSVLSNTKLLKRFGVRLAPWETALDAVIQALS